MTIKRWLGNAMATTDVWTINLSGTVASQTYSITINNKSVTYTANSADTVSTILLSLVNAWSTSTIPEFLELTAAALPSGGPCTSMTVTQNIAGRPSVIAVATTGAAAFTTTNTTVATGPNDFTNAQNWSTGTAPANSDTLVFDNGNIDCKYNLGSSLTGVTVSVEPGYSGLIGLPFINSDNPNTSDSEYRPTSLSLAGGAATVNAPQCGRCNLAFGANTASVRVLASGPRTNIATPVVLITGGNSSSELDINKGDVGLACYQGQTATFPTIKTGYVSQPSSDVTLTIGLGATLTTLMKNGGHVTSRVGATTINQGTSGGTLTLTDSAAVTTLNVFAGTVNLSTTGTVTTINLYGSATLNCDGDPRAKSITNAINVFSTSVSVIDSAKTINNEVLTLAPGGLTSVNVQHGANTSIVYQ